MDVLILSRINCTQTQQIMLSNRSRAERESCQDSVEDRQWDSLPLSCGPRPLRSDSAGVLSQLCEFR